MAVTIKVRRGLEINLPTLSSGEIGFTTDTHETYIGDGTNNHRLSKSINWVTKTADYTAFSNDGIFADTTSNNIEIILPASPNVGDKIIIDDVAKNFDDNHLLIDRNGNEINNEAKNVFCADKSARIECLFSGATYGWSVMSLNGTVTSYDESVTTITTNDTTPDVVGTGLLIIDTAGPLTITDFDNGITGQELTVLFKYDDIIVENNANITLSDGVNFSSKVSDVVTFIYDGSKWIETSKSVQTYN